MNSKSICIQFLSGLNVLFRAFFLILIGSYRTLGTLFFGGSCRYQPSCSDYAQQAFHLHPPSKAIKLIISRVYRCRPGGGYGHDPVPANEK